MAAALSAELGFAAVTNINEAEQQLNQVSHSSLTSEQKEMKKIVKRITKVLQPHFEDAIRKESELAGRPYEKLPDLETLLNQKLQRRSSVLSHDENIRQTTETDQPNVGQVHKGVLDGEEAAAIGQKSEEIQMAPTPDENGADADRTHDEAADEAAIALQLGQDALHVSQTQAQGDGLAENHGHVDGRPEPLTPPRSEKNLLNPLGNGGVPWYFETFDVHGTTVYEERYTGREVLRDMSEELSELDDDELDGLANSDPVRSLDTAESNVAAIKKAVARKRQKRSRGW